MDAAKSSTSDGSKLGYAIVASAKRSLGGDGGTTNSVPRERDSKRIKESSPSSNSLFPLFTRKAHTSAMNCSAAPPPSFVWHSPLGNGGSCLKASLYKPFEKEIELRKAGQRSGKVKVACFDLDGCLINPKNGKSFPSATDEYDYEEAFRGTFARVKEEYDKGSCIVIVSNQKQSSSSDPNRKLKTWKAKMELVAKAIDCPMLILAALSDDGFRKPGRLSWDRGILPCYVEAGGTLNDISVELGAVEEQVSFFVGDAAGRVGDHNDTDRKWALNIGIPFFTPEEFFLGHKPRKYELRGFRPTIEMAEDACETLPSQFFPSSQSAIRPDLVLLVGPPAAGKTTFAKKHFSSRGYRWVNQDTLKTAAKCLAAARQHLIAKDSVVIDNTNRNKSTRAPYISLAKELGANVRCVYFDVSHELCVHNSLYRARAGLHGPDEERKVLPSLAFTSFFKNVEPPSKDEGFDADIVTVKWRFVGDAEAKQRWLLHWQ